MMVKRSFRTSQEFRDYIPKIWEEEEIQVIFLQVNDRFEKLLLRSLKLRDDVRKGEYISEETIDITAYGWIQSFLARTDRYHVIDNVIVGKRSGKILLELYEKKVEFIADEKY